MESSEWPGVGILSGMTEQLGNWGECLLISNHNLTGRYCIVNAQYDIGHRGISLDMQSLKENDSAWKFIQKVDTTPQKKIILIYPLT